MKKILIPFDGSGISLESISNFASTFEPDNWEILLLYINHNEKYIKSEDELMESKKASLSILENAKKALNTFNVKMITGFGDTKDTILRIAKEENIDLLYITHTKFSNFFHLKESFLDTIIKESPVMVLVAPSQNIKTDTLEESHTITLPSQTHLGKNKHILPSRPGNCIYNIEVISGKVSLEHMTYNPDDGNFLVDTEKTKGIPLDNEIKSGESKTFEIFIGLHYGVLDMCQLVNTALLEPASVKYSVMAEDDFN